MTLSEITDVIEGAVAVMCDEMDGRACPRLAAAKAALEKCIDALDEVNRAA